MAKISLETSNQVMRRFQDSASRRSYVRRMIGEGHSPVDIDTPARVRARAATFARSVPNLAVVESPGGAAPMLRLAQEGRGRLPAAVGLERVINRPNFAGTWFLSAGLERCKAVGRSRTVLRGD